MQFSHRSHELVIGRPYSILGQFTGGDIADVALNHACAIDPVDIADELHVDVFSRFGFQRQILVTDVLLFLQPAHGVLAGGNIFDRTDLPERLAEQLAVGISQHVLQEWVGVGDPSRVPIQEKYAILGRLEESPVANF